MADLLVTELAGYPLNDWLLDRADEGKSLRQISDDLADLTDSLVVVSHQTIANWIKRAGWEAQDKERTA